MFALMWNQRFCIFLRYLSTQHPYCATTTMYKIVASIQSRQALGKIGVWAGRNHPSTKNPQLNNAKDQRISLTYKHERPRICLRELQLQFLDIMGCYGLWDTCRGICRDLGGVNILGSPRVAHAEVVNFRYR